MRKDVFIDVHERSNLVEDKNNFLTKMKDLKPYIVKFEENCTMKPRIYLSNYVVIGDHCQLIIVITHDGCIFLRMIKFGELRPELETLFYDSKVMVKA